MLSVWLICAIVKNKFVFNGSNKRTFRQKSLHSLKTPIFKTIFEENGIFMLGVDFFQSIFDDRNKNFQQNFLYPIEDINFLSSNLKRYFTSD